MHDVDFPEPAVEASDPVTPVKGLTYLQFVEFLRDPGEPVPMVSPKRFAAALNMDLQELADQARVHRNTLRRAPDSRGVQAFLREALRAIKAAADLSGDLDKALFWYRFEPLSVFDYVTAERLVADGRTDDLIRYLTALGAGVSG